MRNTVVIAATVALAALFATGARGDEPSVAERFAATAAAGDARYVVGRDALLDAGDAALAVADARADDPDPGVRALARLIRLRHDRPDDVAAWAGALAASQRLVERDEPTGTVRVQWETGTSAGGNVRSTEVVFTADAVPLVIDALRGGENGGTHWQRVNALAVAGALRSADTVPWIVPLLQVPYVSGELTEAALLAIGEPAVAAVRPLLDAPRPYLVMRAVRILAHARDPASTPRFCELLEGSQDGDVIAACADALIALDPEGGAAAAVGRIADFDPIARDRRGGNWDYASVREAALRFGDHALAIARVRLATATDPLVRARLGGLAWELANPTDAAATYAPIGRENMYWRSDPAPEELPAVGRRFFWVNFRYGEIVAGADPPLPLLLERAAALRDDRDVVAAAMSSTPVGVAVARAVILASPRGRAPALMALAAADPDGAVDVLEAYSGADPPEDLAACFAAAFLLLDHPRLRPILERTADRTKTPTGGRAAHEQARPIAAAALAVVRSETTLAGLLATDDATVRLAVARALARRGNPSGAGILVAAALNASGSAYESLRDDLVRAGGAPKPSADDDVAARVLHDAVAARVASPAAARTADAARLRNQPHVISIIGPQLGHYVASGDALAAELGPPSRVLVEEAALFLRDRVAIHAVAALGDDRSIPVLVQCARFLYRDAGTALRRMGEKGLAAAAAVPPPDPLRPAFGERASRHAGATEALDTSPAAIGKAIEGLAEPAPDARGDRSAWKDRMQTYLRVAAKSDEPRKVEPILGVLAATGHDDELLVRDALAALDNVPDPRVDAVCVDRLCVGPLDRDVGAERVLAARHGEGLFAFLRDRVASATGRTRAGLVHAMFSLVLDAARPAEDRDAVAALLRECIADRDPSLASAAAFDLARLHVKRPAASRDDRDAEVTALLDYVRTHGDLGIEADEIANLAAPGAGEAFQASYAIAGSVQALRALAHLQFGPAAPDVEAVMTRRLGEKPFVRHAYVPEEVRALGHLGEDGRRRARAFVAGTAPLHARLVAAWGLAEVHDAEAFDVLLALVEPIDATRETEERVGHRRALIAALGTLDANRAHAEFVRRSLSTRDAEASSNWAEAAMALRRRYPDLAPAAAPPTFPPPK